MRIGDQNITREDMPTMQAWKLNPDHLRQSIQDVLNNKLGVELTPPPDGGASVQQGTMENRGSQWQ